MTFDDIFPGMMGDIWQQPVWLQLWILWMVVINTAAVAFLKQRAGKIIFAVWLANLVCMNLLYFAVGYTRLLGLSHVIFWTPLAVYLVWQLPRLPVLERFGAYVRVLLLTVVLSLVVDYIDVVRYILGERE